jgi:hypothetical protein
MKTYAERMYRSTFSRSRQLLEVNGQLHGPTTLTPGKFPLVPVVYEAGWAPEQVWTLWRREKSCHTGNRTQTIRGTFFLVSCGGVRLSPLGTSAINWPIVPVPDDRWWVWSSRWNENWQGKPKYSRKSALVPLVHHRSHMTWPGLEPGPPRWEAGY